MGIYQGSKLMSGGGGGPSPYEIAKQNGYTGTEQAFNQLLAALEQNATKEETNELLSFVIKNPILLNGTSTSQTAKKIPLPKNSRSIEI